uniref:Uncharacterized protein n=1 Tax=Desulfobacca acetoxidans TaxID=60893 RepID=A0A7C3ZBV4_9BACT
MNGRAWQIICVFGALVFFAPGRALAFTFLWETQGSYVHQMAHFLFAVAMFFLIYEINRGELRAVKGFTSLIWACVFLAWWNLDAIVGHTLDWTLQNPVVLGEGLNRRLLMENAHTWAYYLTKLTHFLLLIPAFYFFYRSLQRLSRESETKTR